MSSYATLNEVITLSGATYTAEQQERITALLPLISDMIRNEGKKYGKDVDAMYTGDADYASVVKLVTVDVIVRTMRQSTEGEPASQFSQSALGYSVSGTYAIPGGGIAQSLMENDKKRLGFKRQQFGSITLWPSSEE